MTVSFCDLTQDIVSEFVPLLGVKDLFYLSQVNRQFEAYLHGMPQVQMQFIYEKILFKPTIDIRYKIGISNKDNSLCVGTDSDVSLWHLINGDKTLLQYVKRYFIEESSEENILSLCDRLKNLNQSQHIHLHKCTFSEELINRIDSLYQTKVYISESTPTNCTIPDRWSTVTSMHFDQFLKEESDQKSLLEIEKCVINGDPFEAIYERLGNLSAQVKYNLIYTIWSSAIQRDERLNFHTIEKRVREYLKMNGASNSVLSFALNTELKNYLNS